MNGQTLVKAFVPLPGGAQAVYGPSGILYYGHSDHLGSIRLGSTSSRTLSFDLAYAPFGETYASSGAADPDFTGQRQDTVSGVYDFPAREYSNEGRWASPDPSGPAAFHRTDPQTINRYVYGRNTPLSVIDPTGLDDVLIDDGEDPQNPLSGGASGGGGAGGTWGIDGTGDTGDKGDTIIVNAPTTTITVTDTSTPVSTEDSPLSDTLDGPNTNSQGVAAMAGTGGAYGISLAKETTPIFAIGRTWDTLPLTNNSSYQVINLANWTPEANASIIQGVIDSSTPVFLASPITEGNIISLSNASGFTVFADEISQLMAAGYAWVGEWLIPPLL